MEQLSMEMKRELRLLIDFIEVFCRARHGDSGKAVELKHPHTREVVLCAGCAQLVDYSLARRINCPLDPKPSCKRCRIHCYSREYGARIREVMSFSGKRMILRGRLDYLYHYMF